MNRYFKIIVLLLLPLFVFGQKFRQEIQNYTDVTSLRNESLTPRKNDKVYIHTTKKLYAYDHTNSTSTDDGLNYIVQTAGSHRWVCLNCHLRVELSQDSILLQYDANDVLVQRDTIRLAGGGPDKFNANIVATTTYDPLNTLAGWVAPSNPIQGNTVEVKFTDGTVGNYTWDGSVWVLNFREIDVLTLQNYTELRNLTPDYKHDIVNVQDFTYTFEGNTYTTLGGVFKRLHGSTLTENGGTIIVGVDGTVWERDWDKIHVQPEWWECGGKSFNGVSYTSKNTSADGIYNDRDRINSAAQIGSVIELTEGKTYEIDITVNLDNHTLNLNKATLKRYSFSSSTLTANFASGNNSLTVTDATPYRVGQRIAVMDISGTYGGILTDNTHVNEAGVTNVLTITSIVGNVINVSVVGSVNNNYVAGDKVVILCTMINVGSAGAQIYNGNIDGNRDDYPVEWWNSQYIITGSGFENEDMFVVKNLYIKDNTGECIGVATGIIENVILENSTGSMVHIGAFQLVGSSELGGRILNCVAKNVCQSNVMTGAGGVYKNHNEGVITFSLNSKNWVIDGLRVHTSGTGVLGNLDDNDDNISLFNSFAENCQFIIPSIGGSTPSDDGIVSNIKLINNVFVNCGMLYGVSSGQTITNLTIKDNRFINIMFVFSNLNGFEFTNNYVEDDGTFIWDYTNIYGTMNSSAGFRSYFFIGANNQINNVKISGNTFIGRKVGDTAIYTNGIFIPLISAVNNTTDQGFFTLHKNIEISNNQIQYFPRGIAFSQSYVVVVYKEYQNIKINNNVIKMNSTVIATQWAVMVLPGMECYDNILIGQQGGRQGANTFVAHVIGLFDGSLNLATNRGAQFYNNKVIGSNVTPVTVGQNNCNNKCLIYNNVTNVAIQDLTGGLSTFFNNTVSENTNILD